MAATYTGGISADIQKIKSMAEECVRLKQLLEAKSAEVSAFYARKGGTSYFDPYFYVDGDTEGVLRTDLAYSKDDFSTAIANFPYFEAVLQDGKDKSDASAVAVANGRFEAIVKYTGVIDAIGSK